MNFKLTLSLVIVLLLIAIGLLFIPAKVAQVKDEKTATPLLSPKPTGVKAITFTRDGEKQLAFSRGDKGWEMTFPMKGHAESWQVDSIADALTGLAYKEQFQPEATGSHSPETTGTEHPKSQVAFTDDAGKEHTLALGKRTVGGVYATLDGGKTVYLLEHDPQDSLDKPAQDFRDKTIKEVATDKVAELTIGHGDEAPVTLAKTGDKWLISKPLSARADEPKVKEILDALKTISASGFTQMPKDSAAAGLNPPVLTVTAMVSEPAPAAATAPASAPASAPATAAAPKPTPVTLELGYYTGLSDKKNVYASLAGSKEVFTFSADSFTKLNKQLSDLRDPAVTPAMVGAATEATVTTDGKVAVKVAKKDGVWMLESTAAPVKAGELEVGDWLGDIRNLRAIKFVDNAGDLKSIGLDPPQTRIEMAVPGQSQHEVILMGKGETDVAGGKVTPMMRQGEPTVYLVQTADAQKVIPTALSLRDRAVERLSADEIRAVRISGSAVVGGGLELQREAATWNVTPQGGKSAKADDEKITSLLAEFTPLTAAKYLAENADVAGTPDVTVSLSVLEPVHSAAATQAASSTSAPATGPATSATAPATANVPTLGPELSKPVERTLKLYKTTVDNKAQWKALWDGAAPQWSFEPTTALIEHVTKETYLPAPATQAATQPKTESNK